MKILISGIGGRMGREVERLSIEGYRGAELCGGVDVAPVSSPAPCFTNFDDVNVSADCVVDFSHHSATGALLKYCAQNKLPVVVATTGHTEEEKALIADAAKVIPVFYSANMSLGVALLCELAKTAAAAMPEADIEIIEKHHNRKLDAPSGTALMIADAIRQARSNLECVFGRHGQHKREKNEIGIHAIRMGNIVGEHEVMIGTDTQTITLKHEAHSRALFAEGALAAAAFLIGKAPGQYTMQDLLK